MDDHVLRLLIDATPAKRGAAEFAGAVKTVKSAVTGLERDTAGAFTKLRTGGKVTLDTRNAQRDLATLDARVKQWGARTKSASLSAAAALRTSENEAQRLSARMSALGDVGAIRTLNSELTRLKGNLSSASTPLQVRTARSGFADVSADLKRRAVDLESVARSEIEAAAAADQHGAQLDALRAKYNPLFAASRQYEAALAEIAAAERAGVITSQLAADARQRAAAALTTSSTALGQHAKASKFSGLATSNLAAQFNDIGVMLASGQSPFILAIQQGTQVSQVLNTMGGNAATIGSSLRAAFLSFVSPVSLATVGVIAGGAALAQWAIGALSAGDASTSLEDRMSALQALANGLTGTLDILDTSLSDLAETYGDAALQVRTFAVFQANLRLAEATAQLRAQSGILRESAQGYYTLTDAGRSYRNTLDRIRSDFGVTAGQARALESALQAAATASTFDGQVSALADVQRLLREAGVAAADLPAPLASALAQMIDLSNETAAAQKIADDLAAATAGIAPTIEPAVSQASALKAELAGAMALLNRINAQESKTYSGRGGDPRDYMPGGSQADYESSLDYEPVSAIIERLSPKVKATKPGSSGGSRGRAAALSEEQRATERLTKSIADRLTGLQDEAAALDLVASGQFATLEAAELYAEAQRLGVDTTDAKTAAMLRQIDAMEAIKAAQAAQRDPAQEMRDALNRTAEDGLTDAIMGDFDPKQIVDQLRQSLARNLAQNLLSSIAPGLQTGIGGGVVKGSQQGAQMMRAAIAAGGQQHAAAIRAAMAGGAVPALGGAPTAASGGFLSAVLGGIGMAAGIPVPAFREGGYSTSPVGTSILPVSAFIGAPHYAQGTANTSGGIPAVLHDNEAVVPLSRGRKIPVDLGKAEGSGTGGGVHIGDVTVQVAGGSGRESDPDQAKRIGESVREQLQVLVHKQIAEAARYGSPFNRRGG